MTLENLFFYAQDSDEDIIHVIVLGSMELVQLLAFKIVRLIKNTW